MKRMMSTAATALLSATLFAGAASAQTTWVEVDDSVQVPALGATVDQVDDWKVYGAKGIEIGDISEVIGTDAKTATALVIDFNKDGGYGDVDDVIVPLNQFTKNDKGLVLNAQPAAIKSMEIYKD